MDKPHPAQKAPYVIDEPAGKKAWCACGLSAKQPYCDGAHKSTSMRPVVLTLESGRKVAWCGCKQSSNPPYCDGTHRHL